MYNFVHFYFPFFVHSYSIINKSEVTRVTSSKTIKADKWNNKIISEILKNPTYIGTLIQGKNCKTNRKLPKMVKTDSKSWKICTNHHEPIIDKKTFETVQNILNYSPIVQEDDEFLISKLKCGECHGGFYRRKAKGIFYYWCKSSFRKTGCTLKSIRKDILENMVLCDINSKYNKHYRKLTKEIVNNYAEVVELYNSNKIKIIYKK